MGVEGLILAGTLKMAGQPVGEIYSRGEVLGPDLPSVLLFVQAALFGTSEEIWNVTLDGICLLLPWSQASFAGF